MPQCLCVPMTPHPSIPCLSHHYSVHPSDPSVSPRRSQHSPLPLSLSLPPLLLLHIDPFCSELLSGGGCRKGLVSCFLSMCVSGQCGNVCEKKLQTKLGGGSECVCRPVRTHTWCQSIYRTCSLDFHSRGKFSFSFFSFWYFFCLVLF